MTQDLETDEHYTVTCRNADFSTYSPDPIVCHGRKCKNNHRTQITKIVAEIMAKTEVSVNKMGKRVPAIICGQLCKNGYVIYLYFCMICVAPPIPKNLF